jgi:hypothetical protein
MLRSFIAWLDDYLAGEGPPAVARAVVGILSFAALLGTLLGSVAVKAGVLVAVLLTLIGFAVLLLTDRRSLHRKSEANQRLVSHYCGFISQQLHSAPQILSWEQVTTIDKNGGAKESIVIRAKTVYDNIQFFRLSFGACWNQPQRLRRKVRVDVRSLSVTGIPGTRLQISTSWRANGKLDLIVHFHTPPRSGSEIRLVLDWDWPSKCIPLIRGEPDEFVFLLTQQALIFGRKKVILPEGCDAYYEPVGFTEDQAGFLIDRTVDDQGRVQFLFECHQLDAHHRAGIRLELKKKGAIA